MSTNYLIENICGSDEVHARDEYYSEGTAVYLSFTGDGLYQFDVKSNRGKESDEITAAAICDALNMIKAFKT
jgi:hypothetical protein